MIISSSDFTYNRQNHLYCIPSNQSVFILSLIPPIPFYVGWTGNPSIVARGEDRRGRRARGGNRYHSRYVNTICSSLIGIVILTSLREHLQRCRTLMILFMMRIINPQKSSSALKVNSVTAALEVGKSMNVVVLTFLMNYISYSELQPQRGHRTERSVSPSASRRKKGFVLALIYDAKIMCQYTPSIVFSKIGKLQSHRRYVSWM